MWSPEPDDNAALARVRLEARAEQRAMDLRSLRDAVAMVEEQVARVPPFMLPQLVEQLGRAHARGVHRLAREVAVAAARSRRLASIP